MSSMKAVTVLGSTGSVGTNTLAVIDSERDKFSLFALVAKKNLSLLAEQCALFRPRYVVVYDDSCVPELSSRLRNLDIHTEILSGLDGIRVVTTHPNVEIVMSAISGAAGLIPTFYAVNSGKRVLLANKESMVMAGYFLNKLATKTGSVLLPVDSEHNAIFQCISGAQSRDLDISDVEKMTLTASGGPFFDADIRDLKFVTPEQAVKHPKWKMGAKISVDSATMANKGLELIEAQHLFGVGSQTLDVVIHPQSIVHSFVEYTDGAVLAQLAVPDMRIPISYCLAYPRRMRLSSSKLNLTEMSTLQFYEVDTRRYPIFKLAKQCLFEGGGSSIFFNAANEVAVASFLDGKIGYLDIYSIIASVMDATEKYSIDNMDDILEVDAAARIKSRECVSLLASKIR